jgi:hypothetical protein
MQYHNMVIDTYNTKINKKIIILKTDFSKRITPSRSWTHKGQSSIQASTEKGKGGGSITRDEVLDEAHISRYKK